MRHLYFMQDSIRKILEAAIRAPSGDNCQPWRIEVGGDVIEVHNVPEADTSLYNTNQAASYIANGTLVESILIASRANGYSPELQLFPDANHPSYIARIQLKPASAADEPFYPYILRRATNRRKYLKKRLNADQKKCFSDAAAQINLAELRLVDEPLQIDRLAAATSKNEKLVLDNEYLHKFLFDHVTWTEEEARKKGVGLFVKTLEMPGPAELIFKLCSKWSRMQTLTKIGMSNLISKANESIYRNAGAFGAVLIHDDSPQSMVSAGMLVQKLWLCATIPSNTFLCIKA